MGETERVVVVGCSGCGASAALRAKTLAPSLDVTIIREHEEQGLLTRCVTPYICCGDVMVAPSYKSDSIFTDLGIHLVNVHAVEIDRASRKVTTADGKVHPYDKLVLAMGARPVPLPVPGIDLPGVFTLRTSGDAVSILHWLNARRVIRAVLIGAGAIGVEEAYLLSDQGVGLTVVEMCQHVMPLVLDSDMSQQVHQNMKGKGINLKLNQRVTAIEGARRVERVVLASGEKVEAGMVIASAGVRPNVELAVKAGLKSGKLGLIVDDFLQTSDKNIYAGGDLIEYANHVTGKTGLGQLRPNAVIAGRVIAKNILGHGVVYPPFINAFCTKFYDMSIAGAGLTDEQARENGIETVAVTQASTSQHSMMRGRKSYTVKLIFRKDNRTLIGGQIVSESDTVVRYIDVIALAIRNNLTAQDLCTFRSAGQPELSPDPGKEPIALAAELALQSNNTHKAVRSHPTRRLTSASP